MGKLSQGNTAVISGGKDEGKEGMRNNGSRSPIAIDRLMLQGREKISHFLPQSQFSDINARFRAVPL